MPPKGIRLMGGAKPVIVTSLDYDKTLRDNLPALAKHIGDGTVTADELAAGYAFAKVTKPDAPPKPIKMGDTLVTSLIKDGATMAYKKSAAAAAGGGAAAQPPAKKIDGKKKVPPADMAAKMAAKKAAMAKQAAEAGGGASSSSSPASAKPSPKPKTIKRPVAKPESPPPAAVLDNNNDDDMLDMLGDRDLTGGSCRGGGGGDTKNSDSDAGDSNDDNSNDSGGGGGGGGGRGSPQQQLRRQEDDQSEENAAATRLQAAERGRQARRSTERLRQEQAAVGSGGGAASSHLQRPDSLQQLAATIPGPFDNVSAALDAQPAHDPRMRTLQNMVVETERERVAAYEARLRNTLQSQIDDIRNGFGAQMESERARAAHVQTALEAQRTSLEDALRQRDEQLQRSQESLGAAAQAALRHADGQPDPRELARQMAEQNENLRRLLSAGSEAERHMHDPQQMQLDAMMRIQKELLTSVGALAHEEAHPVLGGGAGGDAAAFLRSGASHHQQQQPRPPLSAAQDALERRDIAAFLSAVHLSRFIEVVARQDVDVDVLLHMTDEELQAAGVDTLGARKRIFLELDRFDARQEAERRHAHFPFSSPPRLAGHSVTSSHSSPSRPFHPAASSSSSPGHQQQDVFASTDPAQPPSSASSSLLSASLRQYENDDSNNNSSSSSLCLPLPPSLQDHHRVLHSLFRHTGATGWLERTAEMVSEFRDSLPSLYEAVCAKLGVPAASSASSRGPDREELTRFVEREFPHLLSAMDVICFLAAGHEAEHGDMMLLRKLKIGPQRMAWFAVAVPAHGAPEDAEEAPDGPRQQGAAAAEKIYFYSALSKLSQWARPALFQRNRAISVVRLQHVAASQQQQQLSSSATLANPTRSVVHEHRAADQQFLAATVSLLMRKDPGKMSNFPAFLRAYSRPVAASPGHAQEAAGAAAAAAASPASQVNYVQMFLDCFAVYGEENESPELVAAFAQSPRERREQARQRHEQMVEMPADDGDDRGGDDSDGGVWAAAGAEQESAAATLIQSAERGRRARRDVDQRREEHRQEEAAATRIQSIQRGRIARREVDERREGQQQDQQLQRQPDGLPPLSPSTPRHVPSSHSTPAAETPQVGRPLFEQQQPQHHDPTAVADLSDVDQRREAHRQEEAAATRIQSIQRGRIARREVDERRGTQQQQQPSGPSTPRNLSSIHSTPATSTPAVPVDAPSFQQPNFSAEMSKDAAATRLQAVQRGRVARRGVEARRQEQREQAAAATRIQAVHRGRQARANFNNNRQRAGNL